MGKQKATPASGPMSVACPQCKARAGAPCTGRRGPRVRLHIDRWHHWMSDHGEGGGPSVRDYHRRMASGD